MISFYYNDTATTEIYTLSLHDALPILQQQNLHHRILPSSAPAAAGPSWGRQVPGAMSDDVDGAGLPEVREGAGRTGRVTRSEEHTLHSSHANISYAVFCLEKKNSLRS